MSEKNVGDMSVICRKEKLLKTSMLSFYGELVTDNKCRRLVGNHVGDIKNGEKDEIGDNFDMNLDSAEKVGKEMKLKEVYTQSAPEPKAREERPATLDNFLADAPVKEVKDQVKFSDQIKNKIKGLRPLQ